MRTAARERLRPTPTRAIRIQGEELDRFTIGSKSTPDLFHIVLHVHATDSWSCSCEGYRFRKTCRHVKALREAVAA